jgi:hypothetical protein
VDPEPEKVGTRSVTSSLRICEPIECRDLLVRPTVTTGFGWYHYRDSAYDTERWFIRGLIAGAAGHPIIDEICSYWLSGQTVTE